MRGEEEDEEDKRGGNDRTNIDNANINNVNRNNVHIEIRKEYPRPFRRPVFE